MSRTRRLSLRTVCALWLAGVAACDAAAPPPASTRTAPLRIVSLAPSLTHILIALDAGDRIVGADRYSLELDAMAGHRAASLGGVFAPDLERTVELAPELVLVVTTREQQAFLKALAVRGIRVEALPELHTLEDVLSSFARVGAWLGLEPEGVALRARVRGELDAVARSVDSLGAPSVAFVVERDPLYVVGGGSFVNDLIETAGGRNVFAELERPYQPVSLEALAERSPDVLLDTAFGADPGDAAARAARQHWERFGWVRRVELLSDPVVTVPGPELGRAARILREHIHSVPVAEGARPGGGGS